MIRRRVAALVVAIFVALLALESLQNTVEGAALSPVKSLTLKDILEVAEPSLESLEWRAAANRTSLTAIIPENIEDANSLRRAVSFRRIADETLLSDIPPRIFLRDCAFLI